MGATLSMCGLGPSRPDDDRQVRFPSQWLHYGCLYELMDSLSLSRCLTR